MGTSESKKDSTAGISLQEGQFETRQDEVLQEIAPSQANTSHPRSQFIYYLKIFFDLGYFMLVIPFRLKLRNDRRSGRKVFQLHTNILQQVNLS